jgi:hypothetical protein
VTQPQAPVWKRLAWFAGLWLAGVTAVGLVSELIRLWLKP